MDQRDLPLPTRINLSDAFQGITQPWTPVIAAEVADQRTGVCAQVRLARLEGAFVWHQHAHEDEVFLVLAGRLTMRFRAGEVVLGPGELIRVPAGLEHWPVGEDGCQVILIEPASVVNTGDAAADSRTVTDMARLPGSGR